MAARKRTRKCAQLSEWAVVHVPDHFLDLPELAQPRLSGIVSGHPDLIDGKRIRTSPIDSVQGRVVRTKSGSVYKLVGPPLAEYAEFLASEGYALDQDNPIKSVQQFSEAARRLNARRFEAARRDCH